MTTEPAGPIDQAEEETAASEGLAVPAAGKTARAAAVFTIGTALPRALGLLMLPVYTSVLDASEYGALSVLLAIGVAGSFVLSFGLDFAIFRTYFGLNTEQDRRDYVGTVWLFLCVAAPLGAGVVYLVLSSLIDSPLFTHSELAWAIFGCAAQAVATVVPLTVLRAEQQLTRFIIFSGASAMFTTGLLVLFVVVLSEGVRGWLEAVVIANLAAFLVGLAVVPFRRPSAIRLRLVRESVTLGLPMIPHYLAHWGLQLADRAVLAGLVVASQVGVYSLASNLAVPALIIVQAVNQSLMPSYARAAHETELRGQLGGTMFIQSLTVLSVACTLALVLPPLTHLIAPAEYSDAAGLTPWLVLGYAFLGLYYIPMNMIGLVRGQPRWIWLFTVACASLNIALLYLLVPEYGLTSAAVASAVGYGVLFAAILGFAFVTGRRAGEPWPGFPVARFGVIVAAFAVFYGLGANAISGESLGGLALRLGYLAVGLIALASVLPEARSHLPWGSRLASSTT